ncbi:MAG: hydantoinase B/oxoprolinase family protein [Planctomycetes bacterium]|nr:hydantoinase B/oxoprolinase family protein [Planctomycetota bacterium]
MTKAGWEFWIDVGGTFTDCIARRADGTLAVHKLLSSGVYKGIVGEGSSSDCVVDPQRVAEPRDCWRGWGLKLLQDSDVPVREFDACTGQMHLERALPARPAPGTRYELRCGEEAPVIGIRRLMGKRLDESIGPVRVRLGTTRGTNALLERKGAATGFVTTRGFADVLRIGYQTRPRLFDLHIRKPEPLYCDVVEIEERVGARGEVLRPLDEDDAREKLLRLREAGIAALAICLLNSYRNPAHERALERIARELGFESVSVSSTLSPLQGIVPRGETTVIDAYLTPVLREYIASIRAGLPEADLKLITSAGGLVDADAFVAKDSILSGPAAGVVGCAHVATRAGFERAIGFDMGGTSTDVSRFDGQYERRHEMEIEDRSTGGSVRVVGDMLAIETVAAGGGSICGFDGIKPTVGPASAGADPGPACYGRGGPLCLTDVNFVLGRIRSEYFPFPLDRGAVEERLEALIEEIAASTGKRYAPHELAAGFVDIANGHMATAIKKVSLQRGYDPREYVLVCFGGAGGQHACAIAGALGIRRILLHPLAGVLSAYGVGMADVQRFAARHVGRNLDETVLAELEPFFGAAESDLKTQVRAEGVPEKRIAPPRRLLDLRYDGQDATITVARPPGDDWRDAFERSHRQMYGFAYAGRPVQIHTARVEVTGTTAKPPSPHITAGASRPKPDRRVEVWFDGTSRDTAVYLRERLRPGYPLRGPKIIVERTGTIVIEPGWRSEMTSDGTIVLTLLKEGADHLKEPRGAAPVAVADRYDPVALELFNNHFAAIAEQMGTTLEKTALSTNVKERRDFSCAVYDAEGDLVANAPHIPVHLGAMGQCVKCLTEDLRTRHAPMRPDDVFITNDPYRGGSHLPDVTVITPVFDADRTTIRFFVANRAHHAEIGGVTPGSMPPHSRNLAEEGVLIRAMRLVADGRLREAELRRVLTGGRYPTRDAEQNMADIRAQVAANRCGVRLLQAMVDHSGHARVQAYMRHIQRAAETKMRAALRELPDGEHAFTDYLDDDSPIAVRITIRGDDAVVDFTGTGPVLDGNLNATPAIVASAVLYCFRCLIAEDIPLNAGVLAPVRIVLPTGLLNPPAHDDPEQCSAVVGGNVETSQRIVDAIFGALGVVAAGQGTMNNLAFGNERFGYYETIGGGAGAGPAFDGADAVHVHMTNTRLTDTEVLESRYPVRLRRFSIRAGSGGAGRHHGGDGIVREIEFLQALEVSLVTQRRLRPPYGLQGGEAGSAGRNRILRDSGSEEFLGAVARVSVRPGDVLRIETPGGGGYGPVE